MAFASNSGGGPMADINVTPLVDVMLVLLIIFMVTMPIQTYPIKIDLPIPSNVTVENTPKEPIKLKIDSMGNVFWNDAPVQSMDALEQMMAEEIRGQNVPDQRMLQIETDNSTPYDRFTRVLAAAKNAKMKKIGFVQN